MKIAVYLCECGSNISDKVDLDVVKGAIEKLVNVTSVRRVGLMCSFDGVNELVEDLKKNKPDRVVIAACSPRDHEKTFMNALSQAGINPYFMQLVNIREQLAWVSTDVTKASQKAIVMLKGALARVVLHEPLEKAKLDMCTDVLIIGAGPAGLKAAQFLANAGRKVVIVEKSPMIGGLPVQYGELFPKMECGPCMLEPIEHEILHGDYSENIRIMTTSEVEAVKGFYGNFEVTVKSNPRYVDVHKCIGCAECINACPVSIKNSYNFGMSDKKAMDFTFFGSLPNATYIDYEACLRSKGQDCQLCKQACPIEDTVLFDEKEASEQLKVGAILIATGGSLYDLSKFPKLGYGSIPDVIHSLQFERILAATGPLGGQILKADGTVPKSIAIIHCVGSLDSYHKGYCSGTCCQTAFKFNHEIHHKLKDVKVTHFYKEFSFAGKDNYILADHSRHEKDNNYIRYYNIDDIVVTQEKEHKYVQFKDANSKKSKIDVDMVILLPAVVGSTDTEKLSKLLEVSIDKEGFFEELHGIADSASSKVKGVYLAGSCQSPKDIKETMTQGLAAAGAILSGLVPGRQLEVEPITASVIEDKCAGCRVCVTICPYKAISFDIDKKKSTINAVLCMGCGTCVAGCPAEAIKGNHFTRDEIFAEIKGVLS